MYCVAPSIGAAESAIQAQLADVFLVFQLLNPPGVNCSDACCSPRLRAWNAGARLNVDARHSLSSLATWRQVWWPTTALAQPLDNSSGAPQELAAALEDGGGTGKDRGGDLGVRGPAVSIREVLDAAGAGLPRRRGRDNRGGDDS